MIPAWMNELGEVAAGVSVSDLTRYGPVPGSKQAAILMLFAGGMAAPQDASVLLIRKTDSLRNHAGHVGFPGGGIDPSDVDAVAAALRETEEETTLPAREVTVCGRLPEVHIPASSYNVHPIIGWTPTLWPVAPGEGEEIAGTYWVPVADLMNPAHRFTAQHPSGFTGPGFAVGELFIWGFTAGLLARLMRLAGWDRPWDVTKLVPIPAAFAQPSNVESRP